MCLCATSRTNSHATIWYPLFTGGMSTTLLPECLTPMLLLTFWLHWTVYIRAWSLQWNFLLRILSLSLAFRSLRMGQNLKLVFKESRLTLVYSYIFKAMLRNVTKPFYWRQCCIVPMPCHLRQKPFNEECAKLRSIFSRLDYPISLVNATINIFILSK